MQSRITSRLLFAWAVFTVAATLPLLFLGAEVTTKQVGMVDPQGLRHPLHFFQGLLGEQSVGWLIEHGHRFAGWIVGNCVIVLAVLLWIKEPRLWVRWLGLLALALVCLQGTVGIFRIELNALFGKTLALFHGAFAPVVFTTLASLALFASPWWTRQRNPIQNSKRFRQFSLLVAGFIYIQLVLGGLVRHKDFILSARAHVLGAFAVVAAVTWLVKLGLEEEGGLPRTVKGLIGLVIVQVLLGMETWLSKFHLPSDWRQLEPLALSADFVRSLHYVVGTLTFATACLTALVAQRGVLWEARGADTGSFAKLEVSA